MQGRRHLVRRGRDQPDGGQVARPGRKPCPGAVGMADGSHRQGETSQAAERRRPRAAGRDAASPRRRSSSALVQPREPRDSRDARRGWPTDAGARPDGIAQGDEARRQDGPRARSPTCRRASRSRNRHRELDASGGADAVSKSEAKQRRALFMRSTPTRLEGRLGRVVRATGGSRGEGSAASARARRSKLPTGGEPPTAATRPRPCAG